MLIYTEKHLTSDLKSEDIERWGLVFDHKYYVEYQPPDNENNRIKDKAFIEKYKGVKVPFYEYLIGFETLIDALLFGLSHGDDQEAVNVECWIIEHNYPKVEEWDDAIEIHFKMAFFN